MNMRLPLIIIFSIGIGVSSMGIIGGLRGYNGSGQIHYDVYYGIRDPESFSDEQMAKDAKTAAKVVNNISGRFFWPLMGTLSGLIASLIGLGLAIRIRR